MTIYSRINPKYTKKELTLLQKIVRDFLLKKPLVYNIKDIAILKDKDIDNTLDKFIRKSLQYSLDEERGRLVIFDTYRIIDKNIEFSLTPTFKEALLEKNRYKIFSLRELLFFSYDFTKEFYYMFILGKDRSSFYINIDELRTALDLKEYERFYDFERNILKILLRDINNNTKYSLSYEKIKKTSYKNSKVTGFNFEVRDKNQEEKVESVNRLISIAASKIKDYKGVYDLLYNNLKIYHRTELELLVHKAVKEAKKKKLSFEKALEAILSTKNQFKLLTEFTGHYSTPIKLENQISIKLEELGYRDFFENLIDSNMFLLKLYSVKDMKEVSFEKNGILLSIIYRPKGDSEIKVFKINS